MEVAKALRGTSTLLILDEPTTSLSLPERRRLFDAARRLRQRGCALIYITQIQFIEPARLAIGFELQVIGAVILGGTNIFGGEGSYVGTALGALFLYFTAQWMTYAGISPYFQEAITGALIIGVIGMDCALHRNRKRLEELA